MAALTCELCGGKLMGRPGGVFECDSCGMEYDSAWAKEKIQEIRGSVKVEGTVQVAGKVEVEGMATAATMTAKAFQSLADRDREAAKASFDRALEADPNYGDAHVGLAMMEHGGGRDINVYFDKVFSGWLPEDNHFRRARQSRGSEVFNAALARYEARRAEREARIAENKAKGRARAGEFAALRAKYAPAAAHISGDEHVLLGGDGTLRKYDLSLDVAQMEVRNAVYVHCLTVGVVGSKRYITVIRGDGEVWLLRSNDCCERIFRAEEGVIQVAPCFSYSMLAVVGLKKDGTVVTWKDGWERTLAEKLRATGKWRDIVRLVEHQQQIYAIRQDGALLSWELRENQPVELVPPGDLVDAVAIAHYGEDFLCLHADGTVSSVGSHKWHAGEAMMAVREWSEIVDLAYDSPYFVTGLKADGTVVVQPVACMDDSDYKVELLEKARKQTAAIRNAVALFEGHALLKDGTICPVTARSNNWEGCRLFDDAETVEELHRWLRDAEAREQARMLAQRKAELEARRDALQQEKQALERELPTLKGFFAGKRRKEVEARLPAVTAELNEVLQKLEAL